MRVNSILLSVFAAPLLLLLRDGGLACANALNAKLTSLDESTPEYRRMHLASPAASSPTASLTESHVSEMDKTVHGDTKSEDRVETNFAAVLESSAHALTDVAAKVDRFRGKETLTMTKAQPFSTTSYAFSTKYSMIFEDFARREQTMSARVLATLLMSNNVLKGTKLYARPLTIVKALLSKKSLLQVMQVIVSLRFVSGMAGYSDALHRQLIYLHTHAHRVITDAWMHMGMDPKELLNVIKWSPNDYDAVTLAFFHHWLLYNIRFKEVHSAALSMEEAFMQLFRNKPLGQVDDYVGRLEKTPYQEALAKTLRGIYAEMSNQDSLLNKSKAQILLFRMTQVKKTPLHLRPFANIAVPAGPINAQAFAHLLGEVRRMTPGAVFARPMDIVGTLLSLRTPAEVVQALASLYSIPGNGFVASEMHRILASLYPPGTMRHVWMETGLQPTTIIESCTAGRLLQHDVHLQPLLSEYAAYSKMYRDAHPYAIETRDA